MRGGGTMRRDATAAQDKVEHPTSTVELPGQDCSETISVRPIWDTELKSTNLEDVMS